LHTSKGDCVGLTLTESTRFSKGVKSRSFKRAFCRGGVSLVDYLGKGPRKKPEGARWQVIWKGLIFQRCTFGMDLWGARESLGRALSAYGATWATKLQTSINAEGSERKTSQWVRGRRYCSSRSHLGLGEGTSTLYAWLLDTELVTDRRAPAGRTGGGQCVNKKVGEKEGNCSMANTGL